MNESNLCSILSKESGESIAGSAPYAKHFIFISWPKKFWGYEALNAKGGFPKGIKKWMKEKSNYYGKISIRLIDNKEKNDDNSDIFIYPDKSIYQNVNQKNIIKVLDLHFQQNIQTSKFNQKFFNDQIFICTHGRHDKCCAKYGQKVAQLMRNYVAKNNLKLDIWESSHLGGHRFAATLIDFPNGNSYGRLTPQEIPSFFKCRSTNNIYAPAYRGSVFLMEFEQIAEANIQHYCFAKKLSCDVEIKKIEKINNKKFSCYAKLDLKKKFAKNQNNFTKEILFNFVLKEFKNPSSCNSIDDLSIRKCWEIENPVNI